MTPDDHGHASSRSPEASKSDRDFASPLCLGDNRVIQVAHRFKPAENPVTDIKGLRDDFKTKDRIASLAPIAGVQCPRTHPTGNPDEYVMNTWINNDDASRSNDDEGQSDQGGEQGNKGNSDDEPEEDGDGDGGGTGTDTDNRRAQPTPNGPLSCPYRKRNKSRFNIRRHVACTKPIKDLSAVKYVHPLGILGHMIVPPLTSCT
jgi:hypothetical protein